MNGWNPIWGYERLLEPPAEDWTGYCRHCVNNTCPYNNEEDCAVYKYGCDDDCDEKDIIY